MLLRPRRLRQSKAIRDLVQENNLSVNDFIYPLFIKDEKNAYDEIAAMPGVFRFGIERLLSEVEELLSLGIKAIALFPITPNELKITKRLKVTMQIILLVKLFGKLKRDSLKCLLCLMLH